MTRIDWEQKVMGGWERGAGFYPCWITRPLDDKTRLETEGDGWMGEGCGLRPSLDN